MAAPVAAAAAGKAAGALTSAAGAASSSAASGAAAGAKGSSSQIARRLLQEGARQGAQDDEGKNRSTKLVIGLVIGLLTLPIFLVGAAAAGGAAVAGSTSPPTQPPSDLALAVDDIAKAQGVDPKILLSLAFEANAWGSPQQVDAPAREKAVPADMLAAVDRGKLATGGSTITLLALDGGRQVGDWVGDRPPGGDDQSRPLGFMQIAPSVWRTLAPQVGAKDAWNPRESLAVAAKYIAGHGGGSIDAQAQASAAAAAFALENHIAVDQAGADDFAARLLRDVTLAGAQGEVADYTCLGRGRMVVTQTFGPVDAPFEPRDPHPGGTAAHFHTGYDLACTGGVTDVPLYSGMAGVVTQAFAGEGGFGKTVVVSSGNVHERYGHMDRIDVGVGQAVLPGEQLGLMGNTGNSTGAHLHFEVDLGPAPATRYSVDPAPYFKVPGS